MNFLNCGNLKMKRLTNRCGKVFKPSPVPVRADMNDELNEEWKTLNDLIWQTVGCVAEKQTKEPLQSTSGAAKNAPVIPDLSYIWKNENPEPDNIEVIKDNRRIYISNIPFRFTSDDLTTLCEKVGSVTSAEVIYNERGSKGFGFVSFFSEWAARLAITQLDGLVIDGRKIEVHPATPRERTKDEIKQKKKAEEDISGVFKDSQHIWESLRKLYLKE